MEITLGQQYNIMEKPIVILYTYINHHAQPPIITQHDHCSTYCCYYDKIYLQLIDMGGLRLQRAIGIDIQ